MAARTEVTPSTSGAITNWQLNKTNLGSCLLELYEKKLWTDVKFRCTDQDKDDDDDRIHAHKLILSARSPVFQHMFFGALSECLVEINAENKILDLLLRYVYSDEVLLCKDTASGVLQLAHMYQIPSLVEVCADYLKSILTPEHACDILRLAILYEISSLKEACFLVIDENASDILDSDAFFNLNKDALLMILKGDTFFADEEKLFEKVKKWARKQLAERQSRLSQDTILEYLGESFDELMRKDRVRIIETLKCNTDKADDDENSQHSVYSQFDIEVSRDVNMISLTIGNIEPLFKFEHFETLNPYRDNETGNSLSELFERYTDKVISLVMYSKFHRRHERRVIIYSRKDNIDLDKRSYPTIHGTISIPRLNFTQTFQVNPLKTQHEVSFETPLKIKKSATAYTVELRLMFNCCMQQNYCFNRQMKIRCCRMREEMKSPNGHICLSPRPQKNCPLESIRFQNVSNRE